jgi:hypothetical protein
LDIDIKKILTRLCEYWEAPTYKALAPKLDVAESTPSSWVTKSHIPFKECLMTVEKFGCSLDELVFGIKREALNDQALISSIQVGMEQAYELELIEKADDKAAKALAILAVKAYKKKTRSDEGGAS